MSNHWKISCLDCKENHYFHDSNHQDDLMALLCKHAPAIAALAPLVRESTQVTIELTTFAGRIDPDWFAAHVTHRLSPVDEYGALPGQCDEYVASVRCTLPTGHPGDHDPTARR